MILTVVIVVLAILALGYLYRLAKGHAAAIRSPQDLRANLRPLDLEAFRNLVDPAEDEFLRTALSPSNYRKARRDRARATLAYISCASDNAAVLVRLGENARRSPDPAMAEAGDKLVNNAIRLRLYALPAKMKLRAAMVIPANARGAELVAERYELVTRQGLLLGRMQYAPAGSEAAV